MYYFGSLRTTKAILSFVFITFVTYKFLPAFIKCVKNLLLSSKELYAIYVIILCGIGLFP